MEASWQAWNVPSRRPVQTDKRPLQRADYISHKETTRITFSRPLRYVLPPAGTRIWTYFDCICERYVRCASNPCYSDDDWWTAQFPPSGLYNVVNVGPACENFVMDASDADFGTHIGIEIYHR